MLQKYNRTLFFYGLSLALPWALWFIVAYMSHQEAQTGQSQALQMVMGLTGLCAPALIALGLIAKNAALVQDVKQRLFNIRHFKGIYIFLTLLLIPLSIILAQLLSLLLGHDLNQFHISGQTSFTSMMFSPWFILLFAPVVEELAWHSYGTDTLRRRFNLFNTCMLFGLYWVIWHLPLSFIQGYYHSNVVSEGLIYSLNFVFSLFVFVILMNWLYYKTGRNLLVAVVFHLTANVSNEIFATHPDSKVIQTGLLLIVSTIVLIKDREMFFSKHELL